MDKQTNKPQVAGILLNSAYMNQLKNNDKSQEQFKEIEKKIYDLNSKILLLNNSLKLLSNNDTNIATQINTINQHISGYGNGPENRVQTADNAFHLLYNLPVVQGGTGIKANRAMYCTQGEYIGTETVKQSQIFSFDTINEEIVDTSQVLVIKKYNVDKKDYELYVIPSYYEDAFEFYKNKEVEFVSGIITQFSWLYNYEEAKPYVKITAKAKSSDIVMTNEMLSKAIFNEPNVVYSYFMMIYAE